MDTPLTVAFFDHQREHHRITFPPALTDNLFPHVKKQICDVLGVKDQEMFWNEREEEMDESEDEDDLFSPLPPLNPDEDPPARPLASKEDFEAAIENLKTAVDKHGNVPNLEIALSRNPPPVMACHINTIRTSKKPGERHLKYSERMEKIRVLEHTGITCDGCEKSNFAGLRYKCIRCFNIDLCYACYTADRFADHPDHSREHPMKCIDLYFNDDTRTTHSTCTITALACLYCEEKGFTPLRFYEHLKHVHMPLNAPNTSMDDREAHMREMFDKLSRGMIQRSGDNQEREQELIRREREVAGRESGVESRQKQIDAIIEEKRRQVTALEAKMKEVEERERAVEERERALGEVERLPRKMRRMKIADPEKDETPVADEFVDLNKTSSDSDESYVIIDRDFNDREKSP